MDAAGYLYLKDDGKYLKIGKTVNPSRRENDYITENLTIRKLDEMVFLSGEESLRMESKLLQETSAYSIENCNGNSTEWRVRCPEVIHAWIAFKEEHSLVNAKTWETNKALLIRKAQNLHLTQLYTKEEVDAEISKVSASHADAESDLRASANQANQKSAALKKDLESLARDSEIAANELLEAVNRERCERLHAEAVAKAREEEVKRAAEELFARHRSESLMKEGLANAEINRLKATALHNKAEGAFASAIEGCKTFAEGFTTCEVGDSPEDTFGAIALAFAGVSAVAVTCFICLLFAL